jgi:hypothetical protein
MMFVHHHGLLMMMMAYDPFVMTIDCRYRHPAALYRQPRPQPQEQLLPQRLGAEPSSFIYYILMM